MTDKQFEYELARLRHPAGQAMRAKENDPETALARAVGVLTERESRAPKHGSTNEEMTVGKSSGHSASVLWCWSRSCSASWPGSGLDK